MLEEDIELANGIVASLLVGKPHDASYLWDGVKDVKDMFFADQDRVEDEVSFVSWFERCVDFTCVPVIDGKTVGCIYLVDLKEGDVAAYHAFAAPEFRNPVVTIPLAKRALAFFVKHYGLKRVETVGRMDNRVARLTAARLGFQMQGVLENHQEYSGKAVDLYWSFLEV